MTNIVITEKFYINYSIRDEGDWDPVTKTYGTRKTRLGFATYYEDNVAFHKRKGTIDRWAGKTDTADTVDNTPRTGYTFGRNVTHGGNWNATTVNWRVVDPLGFELEINSGNMAQILQHCTIDKGTILDECVWGWDKDNGSKIVLIPVTSQIYQDAKKTSVRHFAEVIDIKEAQLGDMVEYKNGQMGRYFGKANMITVNKTVSIDAPLGSSSYEATHVMLMDDDLLYFMKSPKLVTCSKAEKRYTPEEAETFLNNLFMKKDRNCTGAGYGYMSGSILTYDKKPATTVSLTEITKAEVDVGIRGDYAKSRYVHSYGNSMLAGNYVLEDANGDQFLIVSQAHEVLGSGRRHAATEDFYEGRSDDVELILAPIVDKSYLTGSGGIKVKSNPNFSTAAYYSSSNRNRELHVNRNLKEFVKFFTIHANYKTYSASMARK